MVLAVYLAASGAPAGAQEESWKGENVLPTKPAKDISFGDNTDGKQVYFPFSGRWPITVRDDRDGWIRIHDGVREGWADKSQFVLVRDAPAYFHRRVQADPKDTWALSMRGAGWLQKGEPDNAIKDFDECIRLDPTDSAAFYNRGIAWSDKKDYDRAIKDYDEAIRLDPKNAYAFNNRGNAWRAKKDYDRAIKDYDEAIRLDPKNAYAPILGHFAARQAKDEAAAKRFLTDSAAKLDESAWPFPVIRFLRGDLDEPALLKLASDDDKRTGARCYLGLDHLLKRRKDAALAHFRWVKDHGTPSFIEYTIAVAELERLERGGK
jgi:lipoprotein NlpI